MTLNLAPLSNPDDIRREAGIASPNPQTQEVPPISSPVTPQEGTTANMSPVAAVYTEQTQTPTVPVSSAEAVSPAMVSPQTEWSPPTSVAEPAVASLPLTSPFPDLDKIRADRQQKPLQGALGDITAPTYVYDKPVGVYVIAVAMLAYALIVVPLLFLEAGSLFTTTELAGSLGNYLGIACLLGGIGLLAKNLYGYWVSVAAIGGTALYYGYQCTQLLRVFTAPGFSSFLGGYFMYLTMLFVAFTGALLWATWYLLKPATAKAFK